MGQDKSLSAVLECQSDVGLAGSFKENPKMIKKLYLPRHIRVKEWEFGPLERLHGAVEHSFHGKTGREEDGFWHPVAWCFWSALENWLCERNGEEDGERLDMQCMSDAVKLCDPRLKEIMWRLVELTVTPSTTWYTLTMLSGFHWWKFVGGGLKAGLCGLKEWGSGGRERIVSLSLLTASNLVLGK